MDWMISPSANKVEYTQKRMTKFAQNLKTVLEGKDELMDMKTFEIIVVPVIENNHYYLVVFDINATTISVIDNVDEEFICPDVQKSYTEKGTPAKVVCHLHLFAIIYNIN
jgi:hypothetical protein